MPADFVMSAFDMLRPAGRAAGQMRVWDNMWNDEFVKSYRIFDRWGAETLPLAGEYFRQTTKELLWDNKLCRNELVVGGRRVDLKNITLPILHVVAEHDHIVPYAAAKPLIAGVGSVEKEEVMLKGGHVSLVAGPNAVKRLWPKLDNWLGSAIGMTSENARAYPRTVTCEGLEYRVTPHGCGRPGGGTGVRAQAARPRSPVYAP